MTMTACKHRHNAGLIADMFALVRADAADDDEEAAAIIDGVSCAGCLARALAHYIADAEGRRP